MAAAALALFAGAATTALADTTVISDQDTTAPSVSGLSIAPVSVDVRDGVTKTFSVVLTATDDLSGVETIRLGYTGPTGGYGITFSPQRTSGDARNGVYEADTGVSAGHPNGLYDFQYLLVRDGVGNYRYYSVDDGVAPATLEVLSNADAVDPVIHGVTVSPEPLDVSGDAGTFTVEVEVTDDASGVKSVSGLLRSPSGRQALSISGLRSPGGGPVHALVTVPRYSEPGEWTVSSLCAYDNAGNSQCLSSSSSPSLAQAFPAAAQLTVTSEAVDAERPALAAFRVVPGHLDVTQGPQDVSVEFDVSDGLAGVQQVFASFMSPRTPGVEQPALMRTVYASPADIRTSKVAADGTRYPGEDEALRMTEGTLEGSVSFPQYDRAGDWTIVSICVIDRVRWMTCYRTGELTDKGDPTLSVTWNRMPVPTISGIDAASYPRGAEPTPTCTATDLEDVTVATTLTTSEPDADGTVTVTCTATDTGGRTGTTSRTYVLDPNSAPTLEGHPSTEPDGKNGWYTSDVTIDWTASDVDGNLDPATVPADEVIGTEGRGLTRSATVADLAGLSATATSTPAVDLDKTAPTIVFTGNTGSYRLDDTLAIDCQSTDAVSGIATRSCTGVAGPAWTFAPGGQASATAEDLAGNVATATSPFTVTVDGDGLCALVRRFSTSKGVAHSLCVKLDNAAAADARGDTTAADGLRAAFAHEVSAQTGKALAREHADALLRLVALL